MDYLTTKSVAELLGVDRNKITDWIANGDLRAVNVGRVSGGLKPRWRISRDALDEFLVARQSTRPMPAPTPRKAAVVSKYY